MKKKIIISLLSSLVLMAGCTSAGKTNSTSSSEVTSESITEIQETSSVADIDDTSDQDNLSPTSDDPTIFDTEDSCITLREYFNQNASILQDKTQVGAQNGDVFLERGYYNSDVLFYEVCGPYYYGPDVRFTDAHGNNIIIDYMADGFGISLDRVFLHMNGDFITYISHNVNDRIYTFTYDEDGNLIQYADESTVYVEEKNDKGSTVYAYPVGKTVDDYFNRWDFDHQGFLYSGLHFDYDGMLYYYTNYQADDGFWYISDVSIENCTYETTEVIEY